MHKEGCGCLRWIVSEELLKSPEEITDKIWTLNIQDDVVEKLAIRHLCYFSHICWTDHQRLSCVSLHGRVDGQRVVVVVVE